MNVWDGTGPTRRDMLSEKPPDYQDFRVIVNQIAGIQEHIGNLTDNLKLIPNLDKMIQDELAKVAAVARKISELTPPADLRTLVEEAKAKAAEVDVRGEVTSLHSFATALQAQMLEIKLAVANLSKAVEQDVKKFQNQLRNDFASYQTKTTKEIGDLRADLGNLQQLVNIQACLDRMK